MASVGIPDIKLSTARLRLRMPRPDDSRALQAIVSDPRVALTTASIPHPYPADGALAFIAKVRSEADPDHCNLAITLLPEDELIGMVGYVSKGEEPELSYIIAPSH